MNFIFKIVVVFCCSLAWAVPQVQTLGEMLGNPPQVGDNLYDESVQAMREDRSFVSYNGEDGEFSKIQTALEQEENRHMILTGSRNFDKEGLLRMLQDNFVRGNISLRGNQLPIILEFPLGSGQNLSANQRVLDELKALASQNDRKVILFVNEEKIYIGNMAASRSFLLEMAQELIPHHGVHLMVLTSTGTFRRFLLEEETISQLFRKIKSSHIIPGEVVPGTVPVVPSGIMTTAEMVERLPIVGQRRSIGEFLASLERNIYDESVKTLRSGVPFINYYGRREEFLKVLATLMRLEKSHILFTGKAGVGKTTILKMLQNHFIKNNISLRKGEEVPIILELNLTDVTTKNPQVIRERVQLAKLFSSELDRRVILYIDEAHATSRMSKDALKSFLGEAMLGKEKVHLVFATTSAESRSFMDDVAFKRRFKEIHIKEFSQSESVELIKQTYLPLWKQTHTGLLGISEDSFRFASQHYKLEQPHAGNPTGIKEFLEGAITHKIVSSDPSGNLEFILEIEDLRNYFKSNLDIELIPGDFDFKIKFKSLWDQFEKDYVGQEGFKGQIKEELKKFFLSPDPKTVPTWVLHGPPGAGKSYFSEILSKVFFKGALLKINAAEYATGGRQISKLIGSPPGTVGSEEQRSILTKFIRENPHGGLIVIEEVDYLHSYIIDFFTNIITDKKFSDGLGIEYDVSKFIIQMNTNIGQEYMIPGEMKEKMNWKQYEMRRGNLLSTQVIDGKSMEVIRPEKLDGIFEKLMTKIAEKSLPHGDDNSGVAAQMIQKQRRRMRPFYLFPPTRDELKFSAQSSLNRFKALADLNYGVRIELEKGVLDSILQLDEFEFEKGHSYVEEQLEDKLYRHMRTFFHLSNQTIKVGIEEKSVLVNSRSMKAQSIIVEANGKKSIFPLNTVGPRSENQWDRNDQMRNRIRSLEREMGKFVYGSEREIRQMKDLLTLKLIDWDTRAVLSLVGTEGNGKTEFAYALARSLFDDSNALFTFSELQRPEDLNRYFRSATGFVGSRDETAFEKWFKNRFHAGGGVILFDELLSIKKNLPARVIQEKIAVLERLKEFLATGFVEIGSKKYDGRSFVVVITGNLASEFFGHIGPGPEYREEIKRIIDEVSKNENIFEILKSSGLGGAHISRLGKVIFKGPLLQEDIAHIIKKKRDRFVDDIKERINSDLSVAISDKIFERMATEISGMTGGMRYVNQVLGKIIWEPISALLVDLSQDGPVTRIEATLQGDNVLWKIGGKSVFLKETIFENNRKEFYWAFRKDNIQKIDHAPTMKDIKTEAILLSEQEKKNVLTHERGGHWLVSFLFSKKNEASFISIVPQQGSKGRVSYRDTKIKGISTLTTILERMVVLQAGHRSVFREGYRSTGGGSAKRSAKRKAREGMPRDDLSLVNYQIDRILDNHLIPGLTRESKGRYQRRFRNFLMDVTKLVADDMIEMGNQSRAFDEIDQKILQKGVILGEELDQLVSKIDFDKEFPNSDERILQFFIDHSKEQGKKHKIQPTVLNDFIKVIQEEFSKRQRWGGHEDGYSSSMKECRRLLLP